MLFGLDSRCLIGYTIQMPIQGPFCFKNTTGKPVTDLHVIFTGTGRLLRNPQIVAGPKGKITATGNQVNILWRRPVAPGRGPSTSRAPTANC